MNINIQIGDIIKVDSSMVLYKYSKENVGMLIESNFDKNIHDNILDEVRWNRAFHESGNNLKLVNILNNKLYLFKCEDYFVITRIDRFVSSCKNNRIEICMKNRRINNINKLLS